jgi:nitroreductase
MKNLIKKTVKLFIPDRIFYLLKSNLAYWDSIKRYAYHSNTYYILDNPNKIKGQIVILYHVIEKGLTMPETRMGFGTKVIKELSDLCNFYIQKGYDINDQTFIHSIEVLNEYLKFHEINNYSLDGDIINMIRNVSLLAGINSTSSQYYFTNSEFFKDHKASFEKFSKSRHSSRNFSNSDIPMEIIYKCIELANNSPSDCNRQPTRVCIVKNKHTIFEILKLQNGNRGFGQLTNVLLVITSDISMFQGDERNEPFLNAGLFSMTLLYALHFNRIGTCLLNWSVTSANDNKLRKILRIPDHEEITVLIACGYLPDEFRIAMSPRLQASEISREIV